MVYGNTVHFEKEDELPLVSAQRFTYTRWSGAEWLECDMLGQGTTSSPPRKSWCAEASNGQWVDTVLNSPMQAI